MSLRRPLGLALLLLTGFSLSFIGATMGDAGTDDDAPDNIEDAWTLPVPGKYQGNLTPDGDADWYEMKAVDLDLLGVPACFEARATGSDSLAELEVTFDEEKSRLVHDTLEPGETPRLGMATPAFKRAYSGLVPLSGNLSWGEYNLSVTVLDTDDLNGDGATGLDAPSLESGEEPVQIPGPCFGGTLDVNDTADAYQFDAEDHEQIMLTFLNVTDDPVNMTLISPDGTEYGPFHTTGNETVHTVEVDTAGTWTLSAWGPTDLSTTYLSGLSLIDDPGEEEEGCSPYC